MRGLPGAAMGKQNASMPNVLVRDVTDDVHAVLVVRAQGRHQSLQQYLTQELQALAQRRPVSEVLDEVAAQRGGRVGLADAVADLEAERAGR